jgi:phage terminase large subunit
MAKVQKVKVDDLILKTVGDPERNPRQVEFLKATPRYVAYGGARGGGKSFAVRFKSIMLALDYPGISMLVIRRTLSELRENHTNVLKRIFNRWPKQIRPGYNDDEKAFTFPNGSRLKLGYCDSESDMLQYQGPEYDVIFIDEATQIFEEWFRIFDVCVRPRADLQDADKYPKRLYLTCNPGGVGHAYVRRLFIDKEYRGEEQPEDYAFIQALVWDNQPLFDADAGYQNALKRYMEEHKLVEPGEEAIWYAKNHATYVNALKTLPDHKREAWLNGRWDVFAGQYFGEFDYETHTCEQFEIPKHWRKSIALDYGLDMLAVLWFATDEHGNSYVYRELNRPDLIVSLAADAIKRETPPEEYIEVNYAPPDLWNRRQDTGKNAAEIFAESGVPLVKAGNDRVQGWLNVKEWFKVGEQKKPRLIIFRSCKTLIKNIPLLQHDETKTNDVATEPHEITHAPDALRYWCSKRQPSAEVEPEPEFHQWKHEEPKEDSYFDGGTVTDEYLTGGY